MSIDIDTVIEMYRDGKISEVLDAVKSDPSLLKCQKEFGDTLLNEAASSGDKEMVSALLEMGASADIDDPCYYSPLIRAIESGSPNTIEIAQLFIQHGADVNTKSYGSNYALEAAIKENSIDIVQFLLDNGADINIRGLADSETPLWTAAIRGDEKMVHFLLDRGANPWPRETNLGTPLDIARRHAKDSEGHIYIAKLLEELMDRQVNEVIKHNETVSYDIHPNLIDLYLYGKIKEVMDIVRTNPSLVKYRDEYEGTLLNNAAACGDKETVAELLAMGANADIDDPQYTPPLVMALASGSPHALEIAQLLLEHGANINTRFQGDLSAIFFALMWGSQKIIDFLLKNGADINILSHKNKQKILGAAAAWGNEEMVRFALNLGADPRLEETMIGTPLDVTRRCITDSPSHQNIVKILEDKIAQLEQNENAGKE